MIKINEDAKKMANLLKSGYSMLNLACPVCNNPIFRDKNGDTLCPICNRKVIFANREYSDDGEEKTELKNNTGDNQIKISDIAILQNLKQIVMVKLKEFTNLLENEKNPEICQKIITTLNQLVKIIKEIEKIFRD